MRFAKRLSDVCESTQHVCELTVGETTRWRNDQLPDTVTLSELNENPKITLLWSREGKGSSDSKAGLLLIHVLGNERIG